MYSRNKMAKVKENDIKNEESANNNCKCHVDHFEYLGRNLSLNSFATLQDTQNTRDE